MSTSAARRSHAKEKEKPQLQAVEVVTTTADEEEEGGPQLIGKLEVSCWCRIIKHLKMGFKYRQ